MIYNSQLSSTKIISFLENNGFKGSVVSINRISELRSFIEDLHSQNLLDETFYENRLKIFDFDISKTMKKAKSIVIATTIQPIVEVDFHFSGTAYKVIVPPTYTNITDKRIYNLLEKVLVNEGYRIEEVHLPEKLLVVMSGTGKYGRNNITYVDGMGSFHRPVTFITDAELDEMKWVNAELHEKCIKCKACIKACPTGAISKNKFLINAEKCLTYFNERSYSFPEWINPQWHNCIIGCMACQNICPINRQYLDNIDNTIVFSEQETLQVLSNISITMLSRSTLDKLKTIGLYDDYSLLSRNLGVLINRAN